jgi:predicted phage terminase large subunit-like protein
LVHVLRGRFGYHDLKIRAIDHARAYRANLVLVEEANVGGALVSELKNAGLRAIAVTPQESKRTRMFIQAGKFENGTALLPKQAPWLAELEDELFAFPYVRHDDQVDSISQALAYEPDHYDPAAITRGMDAFLAGYLFG